jgi:SEC-C motif
MEEDTMPRKRLSRNAPCPCGSGKKYKHCCYPKDNHSRESGPKYPLGTVAMYGPDDKTTTKIAAGVFLHGGAEAIIKRWVATDVTTNPKIQQELRDFFFQHGVKTVAMSEGNMGCPHEEGLDFPHGEDCPFCPFWKGKQGSNRKD